MQISVRANPLVEEKLFFFPLDYAPLVDTGSQACYTLICSLQSSARPMHNMKFVHISMHYNVFNCVV